MRKRLEERQRIATFQAYQTVRIHWMTKAKKGRMPEFRSLLRRTSDMNTIDAQSSSAKATAVLQMVAARAGTKVQPIDRTRIVVGLSHGK